MIQKSCRKSSPVVAAYHVRGNPKKKRTYPQIIPNLQDLQTVTFLVSENHGVIGDHHPMRWGPMDPTRALELEGSHRIHGAIDHLHLAGH